MPDVPEHTENQGREELRPLLQADANHQFVPSNQEELGNRRGIGYPDNQGGIATSLGIGYADENWELDFFNNPAETALVQKKQYAFHFWTKDFKKTDKQIDSFKTDMRDSLTDIYTLIGFFSVFQGVLFQGATQLTSELSCRFYRIPVSLSVLGSLATIAAAFFKLSEVQKCQEDFFKAKRRSKVLETRIRECRNSVRKGLIDSFDFKEIEEKAVKAAEALKSDYKNQLLTANRVRFWLLALFTTFCGYLAWSIYAIICDEYY